MFSRLNSIIEHDTRADAGTLKAESLYRKRISYLKNEFYVTKNNRLNIYLR